MKRSPIVLAATVAGTAGVLAFHPHAATVQSATAAVATPTATATTSSKTSSEKATGVSGAATGDAVTTQYGDAQVRVTVRNGKIVAIQALQLQGNDPKSVQISSSAEPVLHQEALGKQSADVDAVSGATFTSASYAQSLQSGFKAADGSRATLQVPQGGH